MTRLLTFLYGTLLLSALFSTVLSLLVLERSAGYMSSIVGPLEYTCGCDALIAQSASPLSTGLLAIASAISLYVIIGSIARFAWRSVRTIQFVRSLEATAMQENYNGIPVLRIDQEAPTLFTIGWWKPRIIISESLYQSLQEDERLAAFAHEYAHIRRYDVLARAFLNAWIDLFWFIPAMSSLRSLVELRQELIADTDAIHQTGSQPMLSALTTTLTIDYAKTLRNEQPGLAIASFGATNQRLQQLLGQDISLPFRAASIALVSILLFSAATIGVYAAGSSSLYESIASAEEGAGAHCVEELQMSIANPREARSLPLQAQCAVDDEEFMSIVQ